MAKKQSPEALAKKAAVAARKAAASVKKSPRVSLDHEIGKGLSPAKESSQMESDYNLHPKFSKFKKGEG